ncbi:MAG: type II toxin-antitoxin system VapC family toxin [Anaerolineales bacterium]
MATVYTLDASIFINAFNPTEQGHAASRELLDRFRQDGTPMVEPTLLLPETAAAIRRGTDNAELARRFATELHRAAGLFWVELDEKLAQQAVGIAAEHSLRGSDAVYASVALRFGAALVTLDRQQLERIPSAIEALVPADVL